MFANTGAPTTAAATTDATGLATVDLSATPSSMLIATNGDDTALLVLAPQRASHQQGKAPTPAARRRFWELFTGGDIAFAPTAIALDPHSPAYAQFVASRAAIDNDHSHVFATAHGYLTRLRHVAVGGPLYWLPP